MIRVLVDSTVYLPPEVRSAPELRVLSLFVRHAGREYVESQMDIDEFYSHIGDMIEDIPTSSQPSPLEVEKELEDAAQAGDSVIGLFLSSGLSGTYEGAIRAARVVEARHASFRYAFIDTSATGGDSTGGVLEALDAVHAGHSLSHCVQRALFGVQSSRIIFSPDSLAFLRAGGRIGAASALLGGLMNVRPILTVTDGSVRVIAKVRSQKKALSRMLAQLDQDIQEAGGLKHLVVHYIGSKERAVEWAREVVEPHIGRSVDVVPVSPVVGCHVGPAMGLAYQCNNPLALKITGNVQQLACTH